MRSSRAARVICLVVAAGFLLICGCGAYSPERQRNRAYVTRTDLDHATDDVDWILGLTQPTQSFDESVR